jgi:RimJ/RimL family protein N-acetyltransferase
MAAYRKVPIRELATARLRLRPIEMSDAPRVQALIDNFNVMRYMSVAIPWPYPPDGAVTYLSSVLPDMARQEKYLWAITLRERPEEGLIGLIGLFPDAEDEHRGFWLGEPYWRQGFMREAVVAVNDFAFDELEMTELLLSNAEPNVGSHRLKESMGAEVVSVTEGEFVGGTFPNVRWRLTAESWRQYRAAAG